MIKQTLQKIQGFNIRKLITGQKVKSFNSPEYLNIYTKCPSKWLLVDLETGQMYRGMRAPGPYGKWKIINKKIRMV